MNRWVVAGVLVLCACGGAGAGSGGGSAGGVGGGAAGGAGGGAAGGVGGGAAGGAGGGSAGGVGGGSAGGVGGGSAGGVGGGSTGGSGGSGGGSAAGGGGGAATGGGSGGAGGGTGAPCITRITYGAAWLRPAGHTADYDDVSGVVTWDGSCGRDASNNAFATFSNGWKPYFQGPGGCVVALDQRGSCPTAAPAACGTRISYGPAWLRAPNHALDYDDAAGAVTWDGVCRSVGGNGVAQLSNGWSPNFNGACEIALRYQQCGGLYENPVVGVDCPDPGVMKDGNDYFMACTGGGYALRRSTDLVHWQSIGVVMPAANKPAWAASDFWAPELHKVGNQYLAYFSARHTNGVFAIGVATSSTPQGPYTGKPQPLLQTGSPGVIDAHFFRSAAGQNYLLWKPDSNAIGQQTSIRIQPLSADGLSLTGSATTLLVNDKPWEGNVIEGPWMIQEGGYYYLFYSANGYASTAYAIGVARATSPTGPFTKSAGPILVTRGAWAGPGHGSIVRGPSGEWVHVYHAWQSGNVGQPPGRLVLVDRIAFENGWPNMVAAPSRGSQPLP